MGTNSQSQRKYMSTTSDRNDMSFHSHFEPKTLTQPNQGIKHRSVEGLKNTHEDLRRRASYRKIYDTINPSGKPDNGNHQQLNHQQLNANSFTSPNLEQQQQQHQAAGAGQQTTVIDPSPSARNNPSNNPESSFPIAPDVKREVNPPSINPPSTDDTDSEDGRMPISPPNNVNNMLPTTVQIPAAQDSQPI